MTKLVSKTSMNRKKLSVAGRRLARHHTRRTAESRACNATGRIPFTVRRAPSSTGLAHSARVLVCHPQRSRIFCGGLTVSDAKRFFCCRAGGINRRALLPTSRAKSWGRLQLQRNGYCALISNLLDYRALKKQADHPERKYSTSDGDLEHCKESAFTHGRGGGVPIASRTSHRAPEALPGRLKE
jgi:hypothetical protein